MLTNPNFSFYTRTTFDPSTTRVEWTSKQEWIDVMQAKASVHVADGKLETLPGILENKAYVRNWADLESAEAWKAFQLATIADFPEIVILSIEVGEYPAP